MRGWSFALLVLGSVPYGVGSDCGGAPKAPPLVDGGDALDAGGPDAAVPDAGWNDSGPTDSGSPDAGLPDAGPCGPIGFVQAVPGGSLYQVEQHSNAQSQTLALEQAGDLLVAIVYGGQGPGGTGAITTAPNLTFAVKDTAGNTYFAGPMYENSNSHQAALQIFYALAIDGGANTVTVTSDAGASSALSLWTGMFLQEYSGVAASNAVHLSSGRMAPALSLAMSPGAMTLPDDCDLVVAAFDDGNVSGQQLDAGPGWPYRSTDDWNPSGAVDNAPDGGHRSASVDALMFLTLGADKGWVATQMAFRASNTVPLLQPTELQFSSPAQTVPKSACSGVVTIESRGAGAAGPLNTSTGIDVTLSGPGLTFYIDAACKFPIANLLIGAGTSAQSFCFSGSASTGPALITASAPGFSAISQTQTIQ